MEEDHVNGEIQIASNQEPITSPIDEANGTSTTEAATSNVRKTPFAHPCSESVLHPRPALTPEQETKYKQLLEEVLTWKEIPTSSKSTIPITDEQRMWLTRECLLRYLRASKWVVSTAATRLKQTLAWRKEYGLPFKPEYISPENESGKQVILGFDNDSRPCQYLNPGRQNTEKGPRQLHHLVFMLETTIALMPPGQETLNLLISFQQTRTGGGPSLAQGRETMSILQNHYPERLGKSVVTNIPWFFTTFFRLISPFIDPATKAKLKFNEPMRDHVPAQQLLRTHGGDCDFEYDHAVYWPALIALAEERRKEYAERWVQGGKRIGESEIWLRGGERGHEEVGKEANGQGVAEEPDSVPGVTEKAEEIAAVKNEVNGTGIDVAA